MITRTAAAGAAAAVLGIALLGAPVVAAAQGAPDPSDGTNVGCPGRDDSMGMRGWWSAGDRSARTSGYGMQGGMMRGPAAGGSTATTALTDAQRATLVAMTQEEKLAHDVYVELADRYPALTQLPMIARSESRHQEALRTLLERYGIDDPTAGLADGRFADTSVADLYRSLLARATSTEAALEVGVTIEEQDIADLADAMSSLPSGDVRTVYGNLRAASQHHLAMFGG